MENENKNLIFILLVLAIFTGVAVELREGSFAIGFSLFLLLVYLLTKINLNQLGDLSLLKKSRISIITGIFIIVANVLYNFLTNGKIGPLDIMIIPFGLSLICSQKRNVKVASFSRFFAYISFIYIPLYLICYVIFPFLNIKFINLFDHYIVLLPSVLILGLAGIPLEVIAIETVRINGIEEIIMGISGPVSGLYSMFLFIGIIFAYNQTRKMDIYTTFKIFVPCAFIAYVFNLFRIMGILWVAYLCGEEAMLTVLTQSWIIYGAVALLIMMIIKNHV